MDPHRRELERLLRDLLLLLSGNPALANHLLSALRDDLVVPRPAIRVGRVTNVGGLSVCAMAWIISTPKGATISKDEGYPTSRFTMLLSMYQACSMGSIGSSACVLARGPSMGMGLQAPAGFGLELIEGKLMQAFGYRLHPDARGKGFATEAARFIVADAFSRLDMPRIQAIVEEDNAPSRRVLEKLGMVYRRQLVFHQREWLLYRLERPT